MEDLLQHLPEQYRKRGVELVGEGNLISNATFRCALDAADTSVRVINSVIILCHLAWLRISGFKPQIQHYLLNLPFDGKLLCGPQVEEILEKTYKDKKQQRPWGC